MSAFWIVVIIGVGIFLYSAFKRGVLLNTYDLNRSLIEDWVKRKDGKCDTFRFSTYQDDSLVMMKGSTIFVGFFDRHKGESCGFYFELNDGEIVLEKLYFPAGITSWHSTKAREAKLHSTTLYQMLNYAEKSHHGKYPKWRNVK